ncbi:hypothetical protein LJB80_00250 [Bacteroides sp. OttesenSCG-928-F21]|nr:hypothetical protein [Bacteroides sp. OttesenSCG-928-F21]
MALNIYDKNGTLKLVIGPSDSSTHVHGIQEDNSLNLSFTHYEYVMLDVNDYIVIDGARYWMMEQYVPQQKSTIEWTYNCQFYGIESLIKRGLVLKLVDGELLPVFTLTAPASQHMALFVENINRIFGTGEAYKVGEVVASENITISYNSTYINDGLTQLASEAGTEWWFDNLMTVNLTRCEHGAEIVLGYRNGLTKLERATANNVKFFTRLYPLGSTRNIDFATYGSSRLQLPDGQKYAEQPSAATYGIIEHSEETAFSHIYPRRVGTISAVRSEEKTGQDGKPFKIYYFKDAAIPFDPNDYEIGGLVKHVQFESGELNGRDFEVNYNSDTQEFEIITKFPEYSDQLPNDILTPEIGNKYVLWNIKMPNEYYSLAEQEYKEAVDAYMADNNLDKSVYKAPTDYIEIAKRGVKLTIGQRIRLESNVLFPGTGFRNSRITRITRKINIPTQMDIEISDVLSKGKITTIENNVSEIKTIIDNTRAGLPGIVKSYENTPAADTNLYSALKSVRSFISKLYDDVVQGVITFIKGIRFGNWVKGSSGAAVWQDADGNWHFEIDKLTVRMRAYFEEVMIKAMKHVGGSITLSPASLICTLVDEHDEFFRCFFKTNDGERTIRNEFAIGDQARYQTFNLKEGTSSQASNRFYWRLVVGVGDDYIDLSKSDCALDSDAPQPGDEIVQLGNRTDIDRQGATIASAYGEGSPYIRIYNGIESYALPSPKIDLNPYSTKITADSIILESTGEDIASVITGLEDDMEAVKEQTDNMFETWWLPYEPKLDNYPAVEWETDEEKDMHLRDIFVVDNPEDDSLNGTYCRFNKVVNEATGEATYKFDDITDERLIAALKIAVEGRDNARQKRRNFVTQPSVNDVYEAGDTWCNATYTDVNGNVVYDNDNLVAITAKAKGEAFNIAHWKSSSGAMAQIKVLNDTIIATVEGIITEAGILVEEDFARLFVAGMRDSESDIYGAVTAAIEDGISVVTITADQIRLEGLTTINGNTVIREDGVLEALHAIFKQATVTGLFETASTGERFVIDPSDKKLKLYDSLNRLIMDINYGNSNNIYGAIMKSYSYQGDTSLIKHEGRFTSSEVYFSTRKDGDTTYEDSLQVSLSPASNGPISYEKRMYDGGPNLVFNVQRAGRGGSSVSPGVSIRGTWLKADSTRVSGYMVLGTDNIFRFVDTQPY